MRKLIETTIVIVFVLGMLYIISKDTLVPFCDDILLLEKGRETEAIITDISCGGEGPCSLVYDFHIDGTSYNGYCSADDVGFTRGDTVAMLYLVSDPHVNGLVAEVDRKTVRNARAFLGKSDFLHHVFLEKDTI